MLKRWDFRRKTLLLFGILLLDGMLLGSMARITQVRPADNSTDIIADQGEEKLVALTFDDGPHESFTPQLLDGLKERGVHATFFLMGQNIPGNETVVRRIQEEGHLIGNHSYKHMKLTREGEDAVCKSIEMTGEMIGEITGKEPQYLRPPYGDWNEELDCRMEMSTVFWSVDSLDWKLQNTEKIVRRVVKATDDSDIILMHDIFQTSVDAALNIIDTLQRQGYRFVTVDELLID